jgi:hypothetical protein
MTDQSQILDAALRRAAATGGQSVPSLTENILREWLIGHGFLVTHTRNVAGAAAVLVGSQDPIDVTRLARR